MKNRGIALLAVLLLLSGCPRPPRQPVSLSEGIDEDSERRLWIRFDEETRKLDRSGFLYEDRELEQYVNSVVLKIWKPSPANPAISVKVIKNAELNAIAYPTGRIYIHTGILAAMENEAQLAVLLGHEITHVVNRHAARKFTKEKQRSESKAGLNSWLGSFGESLGQFAIMASVNGYSRELEAEADREGLQFAVKAGYHPEEAPRLHELLKQEVDRKKKKVPLVYSTHPKIQDRINSCRALLETGYKGRKGALNAEVFQRHTARMLPDNAVLDIKTGNFKSAEKTIKKYLQGMPNDAKAHFLLGEVFRLDSEAGAEAEALANYQKAIALHQNYPEPYRAVGLLALKKGDKEEARKNLERYLALLPQAADKDYIRQYINECK